MPQVLRHIVMWKLRDPADAPTFKALLEGCAQLVPGMLEFEVGLRESGLEANVDVVLLSTFESAEALEAYLNHPHHKEVGSRLGPLREQRSVLDFWAPG